MSFTATDDGAPPLDDFATSRILVTFGEDGGCDCDATGGTGSVWLAFFALVGLLASRRRLGERR